MFGKNLRYLREKHDMEQVELAKKLGRKSASSISEWEKGKYTPKVKTLNEIAKIFNVNLDDMMTTDLSTGEKVQPETIATHKLPDLTPEEQAKVDAFIQGIIASRD
ncbi:helix-turn-helix transcriptional regulator [Macrococcus animalis]|uniref:helix-turn-helix transcriptional regulator n=1 Tax=Macrococcus animalis TaxID=3395467 RepID=UPI0039BDF346